MTESNFEIKQFHTFEEILTLKGFVNKQPITKEKYKKILGHYDFDFDVKCCLEKPNSRLCNHDHKFGFVVRLQDNSVSILGNVCAKNHFDADTNIRKDLSAYSREKRRQDKFQRFYNLLAAKDIALEKLKVCQNSLEEQESIVSGFYSELEPQLQNILTNRSRDRNIAVYVTLIKHVKGEEESGYEYVEKRSSPTRLGSLNSLRVFGSHYFSTAKHQLKKIRRAFERANNIQQDIKTSELEKLSVEMAAIGNVDKLVDDTQIDVSSFFSNDLTLLCYLHPSSNVRFKTARVVLNRLGKECGKSKAKQWLIDKDSQIKHSNNADKIIIK
ncbi:hypothetical protein [Alteromonas portus]|uniref:hypothetical protein n=1 Tax=Alteromonas portus TaxID=2565549 RepID=UPI003BF8D45E